jgi:hypothetical protein
MYVEVRTHRTNRLDKRINTIRHTQVEKTRITERLLVPFRSNLIYIGTQLIERSAGSFVYNPPTIKFDHCKYREDPALRRATTDHGRP